MLDHLDRLKALTRIAQEEQDLPDYFAARIMRIITLLHDSDGFRDEVEELIEQVGLYDTYAQTGYVGMGVDNHILDASLARLESMISQNAIKEF